jgi:hypothetical protein
MPKATAVWLIDHTTLSFDQIAEFCGLHPLEVQSIADGEVAQHMVGFDPVANGQITREDIKRAEADPNFRMKAQEPEVELVTRAKGPRYTPVARRQDRPDAIAWLLRHYPQLTDGQVSRLVGTTKPTIKAIRDRTHWNVTNIKPQDPVALGLCTREELQGAIDKANRAVARAEKAAQRETRRKEREAADAAAEAASLEQMRAQEDEAFREQQRQSGDIEVPEEDRADKPIGNFERSERDTAPVDSDEPERPDPGNSDRSTD